MMMDLIRGKQTAAQRDLDAAEGRFRDACFAAEIADDDATRQAKEAARGDLESARRRVAELDGAVGAAAVRDEQAKAKSAADETARKWRLAERGFKDRASAAADTQKAIDLFTDAVRRLKLANSAIGENAPVPLEPIGGLLDDGITQAVRKAMIKAGHNWAGSWPWSRDDIPDFVGTVRAANEYLAGFRRS